MRLLHFAAAPMADCLTLKRQVGLPGKSRTRVRSVVVGCRNATRVKLVIRITARDEQGDADDEATGAPGMA
jgi:hypothetical protein